MDSTLRKRIQRTQLIPVHMPGIIATEYEEIKDEKEFVMFYSILS